MGSLTREWEAGRLGNVYIISECGINHDGDYHKALELVSMSIAAGANACKFQTYTAELICAPRNPEYHMLKRCQLSHEQFIDIQKYCTANGIDFMSTGHDIPAVEFLQTLKMKYLKVGSGQAKQEFLDQIKGDTPLLVSLGMGAQPTLTHPALHAFMHCISSYPCPPHAAHINRVGGPILGFSDHTEGHIAAVMAVARGAKFIEKHVTMDRNAEGPDHHMSMDYGDFSHYCGAIREAERMLGMYNPGVQECERRTIAQLEARK